MRTLKKLDWKNYESGWRRYRRFAVRAVIFRGNELLLVRNTGNGFYKFPGGAIEQGESHLDTLIRETKEEMGLTIIPETVHALGRIREIRKSIYRSREIFDHTSYYYYAKVGDFLSKEQIHACQAESGFELACISPETAYQVNSRFFSEERYAFLLREAYILEWLIKKRKKTRASQSRTTGALKKSKNFM